MHDFVKILSLTATTISMWAGAALAAPCSVPNVISNGQVADATKVMDNFNAIANCTESAVTTTGTPIPGSITIFSGSGSVTSGDLTGDVKTVGGTETTLSNSGVSPGHYTNADIIVDAKGRITAAANGAGGGGGGGALPVVRGTGIQAASASNYTVSWPSGSVAGDLAIIFIAGGWDISGAPSGWNLIDKKSGTNWSGSIIAKILTPSDISSGSVIINMTGSFDSVLSIITFQGSTSGIVVTTSAQNASGLSTRPISSSSTASGPMYLYFGSGRTTGNVSVSDGSPLQAYRAGSASGALYGASARPFFGAVNFNYSSVPSGDYQAIVIVTGP